MICNTDLPGFQGYRPIWKRILCFRVEAAPPMVYNRLDTETLNRLFDFLDQQRWAES